MATSWDELRTVGYTGRKLSDEQTAMLRALYATKRHTQDDLAVRFGVSQDTVSEIVRGQRYRTPASDGKPCVSRAVHAKTWHAWALASGYTDERIAYHESLRTPYRHDEYCPSCGTMTVGGQCRTAEQRALARLADD